MKSTIAGLWFLLFTSCSFSQNLADGNPTEWQNPLRYYDAKAHLQYDMTNNDSMVFFCVRITEEQFQMKVAHAGMTLYIDTTGKKKKNIRIEFPIKPSQPSMARMEMPEGHAGAGRNGIKYAIEPALINFQSKGFISGNGTFVQKNAEGILVNGALDSAYNLTIEYQIPIRTFYHPLSQADVERKITFSLVVNALSMPQMNGMPIGGPPMGGGMPGEGPPMGGEGMPAGGMPMDAGGRPDFQEMESLYQSTTTTLKVNFKLTK